MPAAGYPSLPAARATAPRTAREHDVVVSRHSRRAAVVLEDEPVEAPELVEPLVFRRVALHVNAQDLALPKDGAGRERIAVRADRQPVALEVDGPVRHVLHR